jgi:hypothetical protein
MSETVEFCGVQFRIAEKVAALPLMRFAKVAKAGVDATELDGMAAMYDLLEQVIHPDDWAKFERHADHERADGEQLLEVVQAVFVLLADRPTGRSSDSSDGPRTIEPSSTADSSSPGSSVIARLNGSGRPDLALLVRKREESLTA